MENYGSRTVMLTVAEAGGYTAPGQTGPHNMTLSQKANQTNRKLVWSKSKQRTILFFYLLL